MRRESRSNNTRSKRLLLAFILVGLVATRFILAPPSGSAAPINQEQDTPSSPNAAVVYTATTQSADDLLFQDKVLQFRNAIGTRNNGVGGGYLYGRREINWDDVPDEYAAPNALPFDYYNTVSPRGVLITANNGTGLQVSADANNPTSTPPRFGNFNANYPSSFKTFSSERLFSPVGTTSTTITFYVPGTLVPATVSGFGAVFTDVDSTAGPTVVFFYGPTGQQLHFQVVPPSNNGLSFVGVTFNNGERVASVQIIGGSAQLGANDVDGVGSLSDVVAMDDFIYGEPQPNSPTHFRWTGAGADNNWKTPQNWQGNVAPPENSTLEFPNDAGRFTSYNNYGDENTGLATFTSLLFTGSGYTISGTRMFISGGVRTYNLTGNNTISNTTLFLKGGSQVLTVKYAGTALLMPNAVLFLYGIPGSTELTLLLNGDGDLIVFSINGVDSRGDPYFRGKVVKNGPGVLKEENADGAGTFGLNTIIYLNAGTVIPRIRTGSIYLGGGTLAGGAGIYGVLKATGGLIAPGGTNGINGFYAGYANYALTEALTLNPATTLDIQLNGTSDGSNNTQLQYDRLKATGPVDLGGSKLNLHVNFTPAETDQLMILENKDYTNPTSGEVLHFPTTGTFNGLPEGALFTVDGFLFRITYRGGDGNDVVLNGVPRLSVSDVTVTEGNNGTTNAIFTIALSSPSNQIVAVDFSTEDGTATAGSDYQPRSGTRLFNPGQLTQTVTVPINGDTTGEADETFFLSLSDPTSGVLTDGTGIATIVNDDGPPVTASLSVNSPTITEGDTGTTNMVFTVTLSAASTQTVTVDYITSDGSAMNPADYQAVSGTLIFNPGQTTRTITVPVVGDTLPETSETLFVNLMNASNTTIQTTQGTGTITDNDASGVLQFGAPTVNAAESGGSASITVTRTGDTSGAASVSYETSDSTAKQRSDYIFGSGLVQFAPGESSKTIKILLVNDVYVEGTETYSVALNSPSGNFVLGSPNTVVVTINDDDTATPTTNPLDDAQFFVREQYLDFLNREPDAGGLAFWADKITNCGADAACINRERVGVAGAFFLSPEFQETGGFVINVYKAAFDGNTGVRPTYLEFMRDRGRLVIGASLEENKTAFVNNFVSRPEFTAAFPLGLSSAQYVDALNANTGNSLTQTQRDALVNGLALGTETRATVLQQVANNTAFRQRQTNPAFVMMEYYGYLRRNLDLGGFNFWLGIIDSTGSPYSMVCAFIHSPEYQQRFSPIVSRNDSTCGGF